MNKFNYMTFTGEEFNEFAVNAKKYTEEEALELFKSEVDLTVKDRYEKWIKHYSLYAEGEYYHYCTKGERGAFPVWVIEFK